MGAAAGAMAGLSQVASAGLGIYSSYQSGQASKLEGQIRAMRYQTQAEAGRVRAIQVAAAYAEDLQTSISNMLAITAGQGRGVDSATSMALLDKAERVNKNASLTAQSNERLKAIGAEADADAALRAGQNAMTASYLKMGEGAIKLGSSIYNMNWGKA